MANDLVTPVVWGRNVVGLDGLRANLDVRGNLGGAGVTPDEIVVRLRSRPPHEARTAGEEGTVFDHEVLVPLVGSGPGGARFYQRSVDVHAVFPLLRSADETHPEIATVKHPDDVSDSDFRRAFGTNAERGQTSGIQTSDEELVDLERIDEPSSQELFRAAGVEVLEATVVGARVSGSATAAELGALVAKVLVQSVADVFYYTGHGTDSPVDLGHTGLPYATPDVLLASWPAGGDVDVLVMNGCNVLKVAVELNRYTGARRVLGPGEAAARDERTPGLAWSELVRGRPPAVPLILGFWGYAPRDPLGGAEIGEKIGKAIAAGLRGGSLRDRWLALAATTFLEKRALPGWPAALDAEGYWRGEPVAKGTSRGVNVEFFPWP